MPDTISPRDLLIGLFEWDGSIDPTFIVGTDEDAIYPAAVAACLYTGTDGKQYLGWGTGRASDAWLAEHPIPDLNDPAACREWMLALGEDDDHRSSTEFNIWPASSGDLRWLVRGNVRPLEV